VATPYATGRVETAATLETAPSVGRDRTDQTAPTDSRVLGTLAT
jgi:hypothetical protein